MASVAPPLRGPAAAASSECDARSLRRVPGVSKLASFLGSCCCFPLTQQLLSTARREPGLPALSVGPFS